MTTNLHNTKGTGTGTWQAHMEDQVVWRNYRTMIRHGLAIRGGLSRTEGERNESAWWLLITNGVWVMIDWGGSEKWLRNTVKTQGSEDKIQIIRGKRTSKKITKNTQITSEPNNFFSLEWMRIYHDEYFCIISIMVFFCVWFMYSIQYVHILFWSRQISNGYFIDDDL